MPLDSIWRNPISPDSTKKRPKGEATEESVSFISEWFGYRVYPTVTRGAAALDTQRTKTCPFLTDVIGDRAVCIKSAASSGICTISSKSNGPRQDWLVCPLRAFRPLLLNTSVALLFGGDGSRPVRILPAPTLAKPQVRELVTSTLNAGGDCIVYLQNKLGGEISLSRTERSPELSFDVTMVDLVLTDGFPTVKRFGLLEIQTMDFHGSYRAAVKNLEDALRLHGEGFHPTLQNNQQWLRDGIEGPNIANVFKRTFYQMMLKFRIGASDVCSGCILALPVSVWESWQRHLGRPDLNPDEAGVCTLRAPDEPTTSERPKNWIVVFDIDPKAAEGPSGLIVNKLIATSSQALSHYAFEAAPSAAIADGGPVSSIAAQIRIRLSQYWPELAAGLVTRRLSRRKPRA
jgi:hypothetical protein